MCNSEKSLIGTDDIVAGWKGDAQHNNIIGIGMGQSSLGSGSPNSAPHHVSLRQHISCNVFFASANDSFDNRRCNT